MTNDFGPSMATAITQLPTIINITVGRGDDNVTNNPGGTVKDTVR
jgi:hypothetical protein